jgi:hypothetical protein
MMFAFLSADERGTSAPLISGDTFRSFCDNVFDETTPSFSPKLVKPGNLVFVKTDLLPVFFEKYHKKIRHPYILVTHNSDHPVPANFAPYLEDKKIIAWFGQNVENYSHPKLFPIPIGIANRCWAHGNPSTFISKLNERESHLRNIFLYMNFTVATSPNERSKVYWQFINEPYCVYSDPKALSSYLDDLLRTKFVLSPRGNGLDCHRTWEALMMGAIPIVRTSSIDSLYENLPVIIVQDWNEVDQNFLEKKWAEMCMKEYNLKKLYIGFWIDFIKSKR